MSRYNAKVLRWKEIRLLVLTDAHDTAIRDRDAWQLRGRCTVFEVERVLEIKKLQGKPARPAKKEGSEDAGSDQRSNEA